MPNQILRRRGTEAAHTSFTGGTGEITFITDNVMLAVHTSSQVGGFVVPKLTANKRTLDNTGIVYANSTTTLTTATTLTWDGTTLTVDGNLTFTGAQTISTSTGILTITGTSGLTLTSGTSNTLLTQNSVNVFTSEGSGAVVNTLYLKQGKVGFGTTSPTFQVEISHTSSNTSYLAAAAEVALAIYNTNGSANTWSQITFAKAGGGSVTAAIGTQYVAAEQSDIVFGTIQGGGGVVERMRILGGSGGVRVGTAGSILGSIGFAGNTSGLVTLTVAATAGTWTMKLPTGVAGTAGFQLTDAAGDGVTSWASAASSREAKNIIDKFTDSKAALNKMLEVSVYNFKYKKGMGTGDLDTKYTGIMADEAPWAMHFNNKILNPISTFGYTVLSIQALNEKIENLEKKVKELTNN